MEQRRGLRERGSDASSMLRKWNVYGVCTEYVLSPDLFSLYTKLVMEKMTECDGVRTGGKNVNNIRYADDMVLVADSADELQRLLNRLMHVCKRMRLRISKGKTEVMGVTKRSERLPLTISIDGTARFVQIP